MKWGDEERRKKPNLIKTREVMWLALFVVFLAFIVWFFMVLNPQP
jgi:hypothetical protein